VSIEAGKTYPMDIVFAGLADNKAGDKSCIEMELASADGKLWHRLWLTPATKERTAKTLAEFGIKASDAAFWESDCAALVGQKASVETEDHEHNGKTSVQVKWFNGPNRNRERVPLPPSKVASIAAMFAASADDEDSVPW
jgi:hypothetical protein